MVTLTIVVAFEERTESEGTTKVPDNGIANTRGDREDPEMVNDCRSEREVMGIVKGKYDVVPKTEVPVLGSADRTTACWDDGVSEMLTGGVEPEPVRT